MFSFSRKECEAFGLQMAKLDLTGEEEKKLVDEVFANAVSSLSDEDKKLPQVEHILPLLRKGIGIHHSGLLPLLKETIEILFAEGLLKVCSGDVTHIPYLHYRDCVGFSSSCSLKCTASPNMNSLVYVIVGSDPTWSMKKKEVVAAVDTDHVVLWSSMFTQFIAAFTPSVGALFSVDLHISNTSCVFHGIFGVWHHKCTDPLLSRALALISSRSCSPRRPLPWA